MKVILIICAVVFVLGKVWHILAIRARNKAHKDLHDWIDRGM